MRTINRSRLAAATIHVAVLAGLTACSDAPTFPRATTAPDVAHAAFGPKPADGLLVFSGAAGAGGPQVYTYNMVTKTMKQVTQYFSASVGVSPDAKRIATIGPNLYGFGGTDLWMMNIDGSKADTITSYNFKFISSPSFSADGKRLVFSAKDTVVGQDHLWMLDLKTRALTTLGDPAKPAYDSEFAPDGSSIVFVGTADDGNAKPMLMNPAGTIVQQLPAICPVGVSCWEPTWSPDGKRIAFKTDDRVVMVYDIATKTSTTIATDAASPAWSPDGTRLAYSRRLPLDTPIEKSGIFVRGVTVDLEETLLVQYTGFVWDLTWAK